MLEIERLTGGNEGSPHRLLENYLLLPSLVSSSVQQQRGKVRTKRREWEGKGRAGETDAWRKANEMPTASFSRFSPSYFIHLPSLYLSVIPFLMVKGVLLPPLSRTSGSAFGGRIATADLMS